MRLKGDTQFPPFRVRAAFESAFHGRGVAGDVRQSVAGCDPPLPGWVRSLDNETFLARRFLGWANLEDFIVLLRSGFVRNHSVILSCHTKGDLDVKTNYPN